MNLEFFGLSQKLSSSRLTDDEVRKIRLSTEQNKVLALRYGVSAGYICHIKKRRKLARVK